MSCTGATKIVPVTTTYARGGTKVRVIHCPDCDKVLKGAGAWTPSSAIVPRHNAKN